MQEAQALYPVTLDVDYPERQSRWKTLLRLFLAIPVLIFAYILSSAVSAIAVGTWIAIILRGRIPRWMFDFQVRLIDWQVRAYGYFALLTDTYPAFEGDYPIRFNVEYPERVSRWKVIIWKFVTALPHVVVLIFLWIGALVSVVIGWFAVLFTGQLSEGAARLYRRRGTLVPAGRSVRPLATRRVPSRSACRVMREPRARTPTSSEP